ncbi:thioesterase family protein [Pseudomonas sp. yb_2]|uniref:thioesterase family protein n=1 Tax=Pseudomonas sp. yb_2 TaxID=3367218 RepID=UPI00370A0A6C
MNSSSLNGLKVGLIHTESFQVSPKHLVPNVEAEWPGFSDMPEVLATAIMVGFMEQTCIQGLRPYLTSDQRTVGTQVSMSHTAATPVGMVVSARVELTAINGNALIFDVECNDELGVIGKGLHHRAVVDLKRFNAKVAKKTTGYC